MNQPLVLTPRNRIEAIRRLNQAHEKGEVLTGVFYVNTKAPNFIDLLNMTDDPLATFGARAVVEVAGLQKLMRYICKNGFEHHAAMVARHCAGVLAEAMETYLGWEVYRHEG